MIRLNKLGFELKKTRYGVGLSRSEIRKILDLEWAARRARQVQQAAENSKACKEWKAREKKIANKTIDENSIIRSKHYIDNKT